MHAHFPAGDADPAGRRLDDEGTIFRNRESGPRSRGVRDRSADGYARPPILVDAPVVGRSAHAFEEPISPCGGKGEWLTGRTLVVVERGGCRHRVVPHQVDPAPDHNPAFARLGEDATDLACFEHQVVRPSQSNVDAE